MIQATIPTGPRISLNNYLLDLVSKSDDKECSVYLNNVEKQIQKIWGEIIKKNPRSLQLKKIMPERLRIHPSTIYGYKNGRKAISIQMLYQLLIIWKEKCNKTETEFRKKWNEIYYSDLYFSTHSKHHQVNLPRFLNPRLSYLVGWICGDGHLSDYGNHYIIKISEKSTDQLRYILKPLFKEVFNVDVPIFRIYERGYAIQVGCKPIFRFLTQVLKIKVGEIPELVKNLDQVNKKYFLMGLFDSEGTVNSSYLHGRIVIYQSNYEFLEEVMDLFRDLDIRFIGPYRHETRLGIWYHIQIRKKSDILKYIEEIGTCHIDKLKKIKVLKKEIYAHGYRYNAT